MKIQIKDNDIIGDIKFNNKLDIDSKWEYNGKILNNEDTFKKYDIKNGDIIYTNSDFDSFYKNIINRENEFLKNKDINNNKESEYISIIKGKGSQKGIINEGKTNILEEKKKKEEDEINKKLKKQEEINRNLKETHERNKESKIQDEIDKMNEVKEKYNRYNY